MRFRLSLLAGFLLIGSSFSNAVAQNVELVYMKALMRQALGYKESLNVDKMTAINALSLYNLSSARKAAFLEQISSVDAVIILGESGLKAAAAVDFPMPIIVVNGVGKTAAKGPVVRVLDADFKTPEVAESNRVLVADAASFEMPAASLQGGSDLILRCQGVDAVDVINEILAEIVTTKKE